MPYTIFKRVLFHILVCIACAAVNVANPVARWSSLTTDFSSTKITSIGECTVATGVESCIGAASGSDLEAVVAPVLDPSVPRSPILYTKMPSFTFSRFSPLKSLKHAFWNLKQVETRVRLELETWNLD